MRAITHGGLIVLVMAVGLSACGKKDDDGGGSTPSGSATQTATNTATAAASETPPPPPRIVDCTPAQQEAAEPALKSFGQNFRSKGFLATAYVSDTVKVCQFDSQTGRIMAFGEYRFKGKMNNDELSFTVNFDTDATGGNPAYSNFLPDEKLQRIVATKRQVLDFLKTVKKPEDAIGAIPQAAAS